MFYFYSGIGVIIFFYSLLVLIMFLVDDVYRPEKCLVCGDHFKNRDKLGGHYSNVHPDFCREWAER